MTGALLAAVGLLVTASGSASAEAVNPPPPKPRVEAPPPRETPDCMYVAGWHLQENGPPIPFFELRCK
jgi:hypothetical protein